MTARDVTGLYSLLSANFLHILGRFPYEIPEEKEKPLKKKKNHWRKLKKTSGDDAWNRRLLSLVVIELVLIHRHVLIRGPKRSLLGTVSETTVELASLQLSRSVRS